MHYTHESGFQIKFRNNDVSKIRVPIDQVLAYIAQQEDPEGYARLLQDQIQYDGEDQIIQGSDFFDQQRSDLQSAFQDMYPNADIQMTDTDLYEMHYDENTGAYKYTNATSIDARRRLWHFGSFFHKVGNFFEHAASDVVNFVKKDGPKILKYGAIAALAGVDIAVDGPSGISDAAKMFKSGNVLTSLEMTAKDVVSTYVPELAMPLDFISEACFSHPPTMHCTKEGAENAVKDQVIGYVKKHAVSTVLSLL